MEILYGKRDGREEIEITALAMPEVNGNSCTARKIAAWWQELPDLPPGSSRVGVEHSSQAWREPVRAQKLDIFRFVVHRRTELATSRATFWLSWLVQEPVSAMPARAPDTASSGRLPRKARASGLSRPSFRILCAT